jgi:hypothetical protein
MRPVIRRGVILRPLILGALTVGFALVLVLGSGMFVTMVDDLGTLVAAVAATLAAAWRARRVQGRARASWTLMAAAFAAAGLGEGIWAWYELVLRQETPFPSVADVAYLTFPLLALVALLLRPSTVLAGQGRLRAVLDGLLVAGSLFSISWVTALGPTFAAGGTSTLSLTLSFAYPLSDLVLLTTLLVVLTQTPGRLGLVLLAGGLALQALSDSGYTSLAATGSYATGHLIDIGYLAAYLLMMEAALRDQRRATRLEHRGSSWSATLLPYVPAALAVGIAGWQLRPGGANPTLIVGAGLVMVLLADASPQTATDLLKQADMAMYAAKRAGKGTGLLYQPDMTDDADELDLRADVAKAITTQTIDVHFQPLFHPTGTLLGFEALSRWTRNGRSVPPDRFVPAAERAGLLRTLDELVLHQTLALLATGLAHPQDLVVTVNAGVEQLTDPGLPEQLARLLARHDLAPRQLVLEVPEKRLYTDPEATASTLCSRTAASGSAWPWMTSVSDIPHSPGCRRCRRTSSRSTAASSRRSVGPDRARQ